MNGVRVPAVQRGPTTALAACTLLLAGLDVTVGLDPLGWGVGLASLAVVSVVLGLALVRHGRDGLRPADRVTLTRAVLACGVAALTADSFGRPAPVTILVSLAVVALALDLVDGQVARRTGTASALGARFDMEVDAFLVLVLSVYVARSAGMWVLAIGAARYLLLVAARLLPWLRGETPPRYWCKVVAATQGVVLVVATADVLPHPVVDAGLVAATGLLAESFGRQVRWLWRHRDLVEPARAPLPDLRRAEMTT